MRNSPCGKPINIILPAFVFVILVFPAAASAASITDSDWVQGILTRAMNDSGVIKLDYNFGTGKDGAFSGSFESKAPAWRVTGPASILLNTTSVTLSSAPTGLSSGDEVLLINLQGAPSDTTYVGNYEFLEVSSISGNTVTFRTVMAKSYGSSSAQIIFLQRVPQYTTAIVNQMTTSPFNPGSSKTGVIAFRANNMVSIDGSITVSSLGYGGGSGTVQGESIGGAGGVGTGANIGGGGGGACCACTGKYCIGGSGGGGGCATAGAGSSGIYGVGGNAYSSGEKLYLGSGGGGGSCGNLGGSAGTGGKGAGAIIIYARSISGSGHVMAKGEDGQSYTGNCGGNGGGGSGGAVVVKVLGQSSTFPSSQIDVTGGSGIFGGGSGYYSSVANSERFPDGSFTSKAFDGGLTEGANWTNMTVSLSEALTGSSQVKAYYHVCASSDCSDQNVWTECGTFTSGSILRCNTKPGTSVGRYFQYRLDLTRPSGDIYATPSVISVRMDYKSADDVPPAVTIAGAPSGWVNTDQTATLTCTDSGTYATGCDDQSFRFKAYASSPPSSCPRDYSQYQSTDPVSNQMAITSQAWICGAAKDNAGNWNYSARPVNFSIDKNLPAAGITNESSAWNPSTWVKSNNLTLSCSDTGPSGCSPATSYGFVQSPGDCSDTTSLPQSTIARSLMVGSGGTGAASGNHNDFLCIRVSDNAGNKATALSDTLMVDTTMPSTTDDVDTTKWYGSMIQIRFTCSDSTSGCKRVLYCVTDQELSCTPNKEVTASGEKLFESPIITEAVSCGTQPRCNKKVMYQSEDLAGNREQVQTKAPIQIDTAIPTCIMRLPSRAYTTIPDITVSWVASAQGGSPIARVDLQRSTDSGNEWDFQDWSTETSLTGTKVFTGENNHKYYFRCNATNEKGTSSGWSTAATTTVDTQAPPLQLSTDTDLVNATSFAINWLTDDPASVVNYSIYYKEDSGTYKFWKVFTSGNSAIFGQGGSPALRNNVVYTLKINITDIAGNTGESNEVQVKVDTGKPTCTVSSLPIYQPTNTFTVSWSGADGESDVQPDKYALWVKSGSDPWVLYRNLGTFKEMAAIPDGIYRLKCTATDMAGNTGDNSTEKNTTVDVTPPETSPITFSDSIDQGQNLTVKATFTDTIRVSSTSLSYDSETITPVRNITNQNQSVWDVTWTLTDLVTTGQKYFTITVKDANGNENTTDYAFMVKLCDEGTTKKCGPCASGQTTCANGVWGDCVGENASLVRPEICNGLDDDCSGIIDDVGGSTNPGVTHCACTYQATARIPDIQAQQEVCNGLDDNCNQVYQGQSPAQYIDENGGCCTQGQTQTCGADVGICKNKKKTCTDQQKWGPCEWEQGPNPGGEICGNNLDDNCDGSVDESCSPCIDSDGDGYGDPASNLCTYPEQDCADADPNVNPGVPEICNGIDDNCNGQIDEGLTCDHCSNGNQDADEEGTDCGGAECPACFVWGWLWLTAGGVVILLILVYVWLHMKRQGRELTWEELKKKWSPSE